MNYIENMLEKGWSDDEYQFSSFASNYKNRVWRNEVMMRKQERGISDKPGSGWFENYRNLFYQGWL